MRGAFAPAGPGLLRGDDLEQFHCRVSIAVNDGQAAIGRPGTLQAEPRRHGMARDHAHEGGGLDAAEHVVLDQNAAQGSLAGDDLGADFRAAQGQVDAHDAELDDAAGLLQGQQDRLLKMLGGLRSDLVDKAARKPLAAWNEVLTTLTRML